MRRILPFLAPLLSLALFLVSRAHPLHALEFPDPDFGYLFNSLTILRGASPWHVDHPGTPLQVLGGLVMAVRYLVAGSEPSLAKDFFLHPLAYHQAVLATVFALFALAQWACGRALLARGTGYALTLFAQLSPFLLWSGIDYLDHVSPETPLAAALLLLVATLAPGTFVVGERRRAALTGLLLALAATLKATALPLLLLVFLLPGRGARVRALTAFALSYLALTLPIWPSYPRMLGWLWQIGSRSGDYGTGVGKGFLAGALDSPWAMLGCAPLLLALLYASLHRAFLPGRERATGVPWPIGAAAILIALAVLKQPAARYLVVLAPVSALAALYAGRHPVFERRQTLGLLVITCVPLFAVYPHLWLDLMPRRARAAEFIARLETELAGKYGTCQVTVIDDVGIPAFALFSGDQATFAERFGPELAALYPRYTFRSPNTDYFRAFDGPLSTAEWKKRTAAAPCLVFVGRKDYSVRSFAAIFGKPPRFLEEIGPGYFHVMSL